MGIGLRHNAHYVEELAESRPTPIGRMIAVELLEPNPEQPRVELGDLSELIASVKEKGVLEPLLVVQSKTSNGRWMIVAGERRWRAATAADVREVPCVVMDLDEVSVAEIALIENMQRKDLTVWEESDGLRALSDRYGYTHEDIARKLGKSRSTVTEALSIAALPLNIRRECQSNQITSKSILLQIARQPNEEMMSVLVRDVSTQRLNRDQARTARKMQNELHIPIDSKRLSKPHIFRYSAKDGNFDVEIKFKSETVSEDIIAASLREVLKSLET
ncbi:MAG: hypothetical protein NVSMB56_02690 [Pyrinomonadaceae bacterium]